MGKNDKEKFVYFVQSWIPVYSDSPEDPELLHESYEDAMNDLKQAEFLQPENKYEIVTKKIKISKNKNLTTNIIEGDWYDGTYMWLLYGSYDLANTCTFNWIKKLFWRGE